MRSIVDLGRDLGLSVVAEGIANQQIWRDLVALGCELDQGDAIHTPAPPTECQDWMVTYRAGLRPAPVPAQAAGPT